MIPEVVYIENTLGVDYNNLIESMNPVGDQKYAKGTKVTLNVYKEFVPVDTTPEDTTPEDTTPADTTPEDTTPEDTTPADTSPEETTPEDTGGGE